MKTKLKMNFLTKILLLVFLPVLLLTAVAVESLLNASDKLTEIMVQEELTGVSALALEKINSISAIKWSYENNELKKGNYSLADNKLIDRLAESTNTSMTLFWQDTRVVTTIKDADGKRIAGTKANEEVAKKVLSGETYYTPMLDIQGEKYSALYVPLTESSGKVVGMFFVGKKLSAIHKMTTNIIVRNLLVSLAVVLVCVLVSLYFALKIVKKMKLEVSRY